MDNAELPMKSHNSSKLIENNTQLWSRFKNLKKFFLNKLQSICLAKVFKPLLGNGFGDEFYIQLDIR